MSYGSQATVPMRASERWLAPRSLSSLVQPSLSSLVRPLLWLSAQPLSWLVLPLLWLWALPWLWVLPSLLSVLPKSLSEPPCSMTKLAGPWLQLQPCRCLGCRRRL